MHCPNCGKKTDAEHKFCRSCGLQLEKVAQILAEQLPTTVPDEGLKSKKHRVEILLTLLVGGMITMLVLAILYGIVFKLIIDKGEVLQGSIFLLFVVGAMIALALVYYRESLLEKEAKRLAATQPELADAPEKLLTGPSFEPASSVTDRTTELLAAERKRDTREV